MKNQNIIKLAYNPLFFESKRVIMFRNSINRTKYDNIFALKELLYNPVLKILLIKAGMSIILLTKI